MGLHEQIILCLKIRCEKCKKLFRSAFEHLVLYVRN